MEDEPIILDYSHNKLDELPQEILEHGRNLEELYLDSNDIELLPKGIFNLPKLRILSLCDNNLCELSKFLGNLDCITKLDVSKNCISEFPDSIENCTKLLQLDASVNPIVTLPSGLFTLSSLTHLILNETFLECLPENIGELSHLKVLELRQNQLCVLPKSLEKLKQLERLDIGNNEFIDLPVAIGCMRNLQELLADGNAIEEIPPVIGRLANLVLLELSANKLECLPPEIEYMKSLTDLYLSANELLELPENIGSLSSLETLKLDENDLIFLPSSIGRIETLEELDVNTNNLEGLPCSVGQLTRLRALNLDNNCIKSLPEELGNCTSLSLLSLHSNNLVKIPASLGGLHKLQMINLRANMINFLPLTFLDLKNLKALWLSENQSKPVVPLKRKFDERERKDVVTCELLPQKTWDEDDESERQDKNYSSSSDSENGVENVDVHENEAVRTRGSISQSLVNRTKSADDHVTAVTPWYEQEFIEDIVDQNEVLSDRDDNSIENAIAEEGRYNLNGGSTTEEKFCSPNSFAAEGTSSLTLIDTLKSCREKRYTDVASSGNIGTNETTHSCHHAQNESSLSSITQHPFENPSKAGGVWPENRKNDNSLVDAGDSSDEDGNTSRRVSAPVEEEYLDEELLSRTDEGLDWNTTDEEMRLRFNNKRQRNGNALCTYEAFKPTRFNLYTNSDEPSWCTIKRDNSLESASPTIKKKSVTAKLNPLIGAKLARDESPPASRYYGGSENQRYTVTQKYEDKIRALQQQRQKERSRRRNHSSRGEFAVENRDLTFSNVSQVSPPSYEEFYRCNPSASLPAPSYYIISDEGDSVAVQLSDFVLGSPQVKNAEKKKNGKDKRSEGKKSAKQKATSSPPVARLNGFVQQQHRHTSASHYLNNTENRPTISKQNGVLQNLESYKRILQSYTTGHYEEGSKSEEKEGTLKEKHSYQHCDYRDNDAARQNHDDDPSYKYETLQDCSSLEFAPGHESEGGDEGHSSCTLPRTDFKLSINRASSPACVRYTGEVENGLSFNSSQTTDRQFGKKPQPTVHVQHVTVKSGQISRPLSPRLVMTEPRATKEGMTVKHFSTNCKSEDVASFLVQNIRDEISTMPQYHDGSVNERVLSTDEFENVESFKDVCCEKDIELLVTDLDAPHAASPLSSNGQHDVTRKGETSKGKQLQVLKLPTGPTEQIEVRVYRNPGLGFAIGGGVNSGSQVESIYVVSVNPNGPSSHLLRPGDRILEVNKLNLRNVSHEHAVLFLTHNQQLDLLIERIVQ